MGLNLGRLPGNWYLDSNARKVNMRVLYFMLLINLFGASALAQSTSYQTRTTKARLQGTWVLTVQGNPIFRPPAEYTELKMIFKGDSLYWIQPLFGDTLQGVFRAWTDIERQEAAMALRKDVDPRSAPNPDDDRYTYANTIQQYNYLASMLYDRIGPSKELKWDDFSLGARHFIFYETDHQGRRWKMEMERVDAPD
jgi:hypothetical protein